MRRKQEDPSIYMKGAQESGRLWDLQQSSLRSVVENGSMTDLATIGTSEDGTMNPTRIGSKRDHITDSAEISGRGLSYDSSRGD